jgi:hypothetical protein
MASACHYEVLSINVGHLWNERRGLINLFKTLRTRLKTSGVRNYLGRYFLNNCSAIVILVVLLLICNIASPKAEEQAAFPVSRASRAALSLMNRIWHGQKA